MDSLVDNKLFGGIFRNRKILITGITGFKGSWLAVWLQMMGAKVLGIGLAPETDPSHFTLLQLTYHEVDIRDIGALRKILNLEKPDLIFHLAAQALVRKSYIEPIVTYDTNVRGSLNIYTAATELNNLKGIVSITSDKVYENKEHFQPYKEEDQLGGYDMYSSSKACMELMTASYARSFQKELNFPIVTARAGNVIGGGDWAEDRLIPDLIKGIGKNKTMSIRNPMAVRPWQHVLEPLSGYLLLGQQILSGQSINGAWNFGPDYDTVITVRELIERSKSVWNKINCAYESPNDSFHEAGILTVDSTKANKVLHWKPVWDTNQAIEFTITWYKLLMENEVINTATDIQMYVLNAKEQQLIWVFP